MPFIIQQDLDLSLQKLLNTVLEPLSADPASTVEGRVYYNTTSDQARIYADGSWTALGSTMSAADILAALITVDGATSGLDADMLDGQQGTAFAQAVHTHTASQITDFTAAVQTVLDLTIDGAPGALDTLNELAAALGDDPNFSTTITTLVNGKVDSYAVNNPDTAATVTATHNLGSSAVTLQVWELATGNAVHASAVRSLANPTTELAVTFSPAPTAANEYEIVVHG